MNIDKYRPIPFFFITTDDPEELTDEKIFASLKKLKDDGFGGFILFNKPHTGFSAEKYLSKEWFDMVRNFIKAAKELSLRMWINDGFNYPPGSVAGKVREIDGTLSQKRATLKNNMLVFEEADWGYPAFELPRSSELFIKLVYEAYKKEVGEYFGTVIEGFFSDADNRRINSGIWDENSPERNFFPWSDNFSDVFKQLYGYDIKEYLPKIISHISCPQERDYWECASHLYQQWFVNNYKWLKSNGLKYSFHTSDSSPFSAQKCPRSSVFTEGRALDMEKNCDFPGTDQELLDINANNTFFRELFYEPEVSWGDDYNKIQSEQYYNLYGDVRSKQASSAAFLYEKETALCEMFAASNWGATYTDLRAIALWQVMQGIGFIVPHAYHYRLRSKTKYFAPPAFGPHSHLDTEIKNFNDTLATYAAICSEGDLIAPIALLDITDELWKGNDISTQFLNTVQFLNRTPFGFVISDMKGIERKADEFSVVINPGVSLTEKDLNLFSQNNITLINYTETEKLTSLIPLNVAFRGHGTPHYMRRNTLKGEMIIIANTENKDPVSGMLTVHGKEYKIELYLGELAYFLPDECHFREPLILTEENKIKTFSSAQIMYANENILPIERWVDEDYQAIAKTDSCNKLNFTYTVTSPISDVTLYVPKSYMEVISKILVDDEPVAGAQETLVFDDKYVFFDISKYTGNGKHKITVIKNGILNTEDLIFLKGNFDVRLTITERYYKKTGWHFNMHRYIPRHADVFLETPCNEINLTKSWAEQGRPFYSGKATYKLKFTLDKSINGFVYLPEVGFTCSALIDGKKTDPKLWAPYIFDVNLKEGEHEMEIEVTNTLANTLEFYKAPSGIMSPITIYKK